MTVFFSLSLIAVINTLYVTVHMSTLLLAKFSLTSRAETSLAYFGLRPHVFYVTHAMVICNLSQMLGRFWFIWSFLLIACDQLSRAIPVVNHQKPLPNSMSLMSLNPYYIRYKGMTWWYFLQKPPPLWNSLQGYQLLKKKSKLTKKQKWRMLNH